MGDVFGVDFLTNPKMTEGSVDIKLPDLGSIELPSFDNLESSAPEAPKLVPSFNDVGPMETNDGFKNLNASAFAPAPPRMSEEHLMKKKYEILRKFERLSKMGVPLRKRFTIDSPLDEMELELEFIRREKAMDQTIKQFCDWYITGMSALEWGSKNIPLVQAFGLKLDGLSESAQMNVADMEEDFEELYEEYGDKLKMHPLVRIPIRTCMMVYMVHLTNQMAQKSPIPNMDQILRSNPDIARQLASAAMQQQTQSVRAPAAAPPPPPPVSSNPLSGLSNFMSSMIPPPPQQTSVRPNPIAKMANVKLPKPNPQPPAAAIKTPPPPPAPAKQMSGPVNIDDLLKSVNASVETKSVKMPPSAMKKPGGSTGKNSVTIKL